MSTGVKVLGVVVFVCVFWGPLFCESGAVTKSRALQK